MKEFYNHNKKVLNIVFIIIGILLIAYFVWTFYFSKIVIFNKEVDALSTAGKNYFEMYANKIPSRDLDVATVSAKELYTRKFVEAKDLYIPKTKNGCDLDRSWVKVRKENGKAEYYTYLKCGSYENNVDHEGPVIVLNGDKEITLDIKESYKESGVKSVVDQEDGTMAVDQVTIKNNAIDTTKVGTYEISYIAYDGLKNKTTVKRTVKVVRKLEGIIKENTNNKNYYVGTNLNNYVQFSGMLYQIVGLNEDGTIKLISADPISNVVYGNQKEYKKTNIYKWLNDYYYKHIHSKDYIVKSNWCVGNVATANEDGCSVKEKANVGLLTLYEYNRTKENENSYLDTDGMATYFLANRKDDTNVWANSKTISANTLAQIRPVIHIKKGVYVESGNGSREDPYRLGDYQIGKSNSKLQNRIVGEYVYYSDYLFRVMEQEDDGTTLIMVDSIVNDGITVEAGYDDSIDNLKYNNKEKGNLGYKIDHEIKDYLISDDKVMKNTWNVVSFDETAYYDDLKTTSFQSKYSIPKSYDLFSAMPGERSWLIDQSKVEGNILMIGPGGKAFDIAMVSYPENAIRMVIKLNKNTHIVSGEGIGNNPYLIK